MKVEQYIRGKLNKKKMKKYQYTVLRILKILK